MSTAPGRMVRAPAEASGMSRLDYEALLAGLPDAVVGVDEDLRVVLWNPAAEALLGRSARRAIGRGLKEIFAPDTSLIRHLGDTLATGESRSEAEAVVEGAGLAAPVAQSSDWLRTPQSRLS